MCISCGMNKKLRLLLWETCNRSCVGCCNKDWDTANLEVESDFKRYSEILLTGGEPLLYPEKVFSIIGKIREQTDAPIILYTAKVDDLSVMNRLVKAINGITITLHEQYDVKPFLEFCYSVTLPEFVSTRLNVFAGISVPYIPTRWQIKNNITWIKDCPLPTNEVFKRSEAL